jgi:hypothetical protein
VAVPYTVALVVDPMFGEKLQVLTARRHTWVIDTPRNRSAVEEVRIAFPYKEYSIERGVTTFIQWISYAQIERR